MVPFIFVSSNASASLQTSLNAPFHPVFRARNKQDKTSVFNFDAPVAERFEWHIEHSDYVVINGTWGNDLRKQLANVSFNPNFTGNYLTRSAHLDLANTEIVALAEKHNKPLLVLESCTMSRALKSYDPNHSHKSHFRMGLGSWMYGDAEWLEPGEIKAKRYPNLSYYKHTWRHNKNGYIYIMTGLEWDPTSTINPETFIRQSIETIRGKTARKIILKPHPASDVNYTSLVSEYENVELSKAVIKDCIPNMYCAVIDNSTSIFELIDFGIPCFTSKTNFGRDLGNIDLNTIEDMYLASPIEVAAWADRMSCTEIPKDDFKKTNIKTAIELLLNKYKGK